MATYVNVSQEPAPFNPVEVKITFTTVEELKVFRKMLRADVRIPHMLVQDNDLNLTGARLLQPVMHKVFMALEGY